MNISKIMRKGEQHAARRERHKRDGRPDPWVQRVTGERKRWTKAINPIRVAFWTWGKQGATPTKPRTHRKKGTFATRTLRELAGKL